MPLVLSLRNETSIPVEVDAIRIETVRTRSAAEVSRTPVQFGNGQSELGEFFAVAGSAADDEEVVWQGDCSHVKGIGSGMRSGRIIVEGNTGMHLGAEMRGGEIIVRGNAGDWAGAEMHGGRIHVQGDAGHLVGAVYRGGRRGMTGGEILIDGNAGNEIGHTMRRGLIAIGGTCGDAAGFGMIAGTLLLFGATGVRPGAGMRRGTIGMLAAESPPLLLPSFRAAGSDRPVFMRLYLLHLMSLGLKIPPEYLAARYRRYRGDFLEYGKGEILIRDAA